MKMRHNAAEDTYTYSGGEHNHIIDVRDVEVKERVKKAQNQAAVTNKPIRQIILESYIGAEEEVLVKMPAGPNYSRNLRSHAEKSESKPKLKIPKTLEDIELIDIKTNAEEPFLMTDVTNGQSRVIMFSTQKNLDFLATCEDIHMDGTFDTCPDLFHQIYVILGKY